MSLQQLEPIWMSASHIVMLNSKFSEMFYEYCSQEWVYLYQYLSDSNNGIFKCIYISSSLLRRLDKWEQLNGWWVIKLVTTTKHCRNFHGVVELTSIIFISPNTSPISTMEYCNCISVTRDFQCGNGELKLTICCQANACVTTNKMTLMIIRMIVSPSRLVGFQWFNTQMTSTGVYLLNAETVD
jgi:hypothetical protein